MALPTLITYSSPMSPIQVHLFAAARAAVGSGELVVEASNVGELGDEIERIHPAFAKVRRQCSYLVNEIVIHGDPYSAPLSPHDRVDILPPFAGGSR
jgi:molybdopterin converting factor small subunit